MDRDLVSYNIQPSLWWRIKALFKQPDIWISVDKYGVWICAGFDDQKIAAHGGIPTFLRRQNETD